MIIIEVKNTITEKATHVGWARVQISEERISELKGRTKFSKSKQTENRVKDKRTKALDIMDHYRMSDICITGVSDNRKKGVGLKEYLKR